MAVIDFERDYKIRKKRALKIEELPPIEMIEIYKNSGRY